MLKEELMEIVKQQTNLMVLLFNSLIWLEIDNRGFNNKFGECLLNNRDCGRKQKRHHFLDIYGELRGSSY